MSGNPKRITGAWLQPFCANSTAGRRNSDEVAALSSPGRSDPGGGLLSHSQNLDNRAKCDLVQGQVSRRPGTSGRGQFVGLRPLSEGSQLYSRLSTAEDQVVE